MYFPYSQIYPLKTTLPECLLPLTHPWFNQAQSVVKELSEKRWVQNFEILQDINPWVVTKKKYPFVAKINLAEKESDLFLNRVLFAYRLREFVKKEELTEVVIPQKYLVRLKPGELSWKNFIVIAEKIEYDISITPSRRAVKQTAYLFAKTGFVDAHRKNVVPLKDGRLAVIDTDEPFSKDLLSLLLERRQDFLGMDREVEIRHYSFVGLERFLTDPIRSVRRISPKNKLAIYHKILGCMQRETIKNRAYRQAQLILVHGELVCPMTSILQYTRFQNLLKRVNNLVRNSANF